MKRRAASIVASIVMVYYVLVFPQAILDVVQSAIAARWADWVKFAAGLTVNGLFGYLLAFVLYSGDNLLRGSSKHAKWFRSGFASKAAEEKYGCTPKEASALWFRFYDTWALPASPNQHLMTTTYAATYTARAVIFARSMLWSFLAITGLSMWAHWKLFDTYYSSNGAIILAVHVGVAAFFVGAALYLWAFNRLPADDKPATGCWERIEDVFGRSRALFDNDVLRHAPTLPAAHDRVTALRAEYEAKARVGA